MWAWDFQCLLPILAHIFGKKDDPTFFEGLVDANSVGKFDEQLSSLMKWSKEV